MICLESLYLLYLLFALDRYRNAEYIAQKPAGALLPPKVSHFALLDPYLSLHDLQEILSIRALTILFRALCESRLIDPAIHVGDLFRHGDVDAGAGLYGADEFSGFVEGVHCAGIEPCISAAQGDYIQISFLEIDLIEICDLKFASRGGLHLFRIFADVFYRKNRDPSRRSSTSDGQVSPRWTWHGLLRQSR